MNLLRDTISRFSNKEEDTRTDDEIAAEAKADRIKHHRENVRNGPVSYRKLGRGSYRRAEARAQATHQRKVNIRHRRAWLAKQQGIATLRGQLEAVGALPYVDPTFEPAVEIRTGAVLALVQAYGRRDEHGHLAIDEDFDEKYIAEAITTAREAYVNLVTKKKG